MSPAEERVLRAGARAHLRTGLPITLHARFGKVGLRQLDVLEEEGVALGRVIVGHSDTDPDPDYHEALARRGAWVQFDTIRGRFPFTVERRVRYVLEARRRGFLDRVLLSHDVCAQSHLVAFGGTGYDYLPARFGDRLREAGLAEDELRMLFIENPEARARPPGSRPWRTPAGRRGRSTQQEPGVPSTIHLAGRPTPARRSSRTPIETRPSSSKGSTTVERAGRRNGATVKSWRLTTLRSRARAGRAPGRRRRRPAARRCSWP